MSNEYINETDSDVYVVSHNDADVWHFSKIKPAGVVTSGQPFQKTFDDINSALAFIPIEYRPQIDELLD